MDMVGPASTQHLDWRAAAIMQNEVNLWGLNIRSVRSGSLPLVFMM